MIDLHCHVDLYPKPTDVVSKIVNHDIFVLSVTTTPSAWPGTSALAKSSPMIQTALGLHPQLAAERIRELPLFDRYLPETKWVGEIGLDGSPENRSFWPTQQKVFEHILNSCARVGGRIMSIHSRRASAQVIDTINRIPGAGTPILHWFSGTKKELDQAIGCGCWFSVGVPMLASKKGCDLVLRMPRDRVLTETDGPFAEMNGKPAFPWDVSAAVGLLGKVWNVEQDAVESLLGTNLENLRSSIVSF
ncbi:MAG: hydrolase TatD [Planctomycetaceae bacterium]|nr:hydrolase TatD [Planctomycetaceae bacterium]